MRGEFAAASKSGEGLYPKRAGTQKILRVSRGKPQLGSKSQPGMLGFPGGDLGREHDIADSGGFLRIRNLRHGRKRTVGSKHLFVERIPHINTEKRNRGGNVDPICEAEGDVANKLMNLQVDAGVSNSKRIRGRRIRVAGQIEGKGRREGTF